ncbi:MAG: M1 family metallopeptidase [Candidatus Neomarinimicrobiota bacterium]
MRGRNASHSLLIFGIILLTFFTRLFSRTDWRNTANYRIDAQLDDSLHQLEGSETIVYINSSPDSISQIWLLLYPNAYRNEETAFGREQRRDRQTAFHFSPEKDRGYIDLKSVRIDEKSIEISTPPDSSDLGIIHLPEMLSPGDSVRIDIDYTLKFPNIFSRSGYSRGQYQVFQWYPKIPVYDANGWHPYPYLDNGEYYYEFGDYDVTINLPEDFIVGATGTLVSPTSEIARMDSLAKVGALFVNMSDADRNRTLKKQMQLADTSARTKTLRFVARNVVDFGWIADRNFWVQKEYFTYPGARDSVTLWNLFLPENAKAWRNSLTTVQNTLSAYGDLCGPYPYPTVSIVDGSKSPTSDGMEYPMLTNIAPQSFDLLMQSAISHEVGHNWFYGILGFNERENAWMDEGINNWAECRYFDRFVPIEEQRILPEPFRNYLLTDFTHTTLNRFSFDLISGMNSELPSNLSAEQYPLMQYASAVYAKPSIGLTLIEQYVGREKFDSAMKTFYDEWKFRHPQPDDFRASLERSLNLDLSWFFDDVIGTTKRLDYQLQSTSSKLKDDRWVTDVVIKNTGDLFTPVFVRLSKDGNTLDSAWIFPKASRETFRFKTKSKPSSIAIDPDHLTPDVDFSNNYSKLPILLTPILNPDKPDRFQVFFLPFATADYTNGIQTGAIFFRGNITPIRHQFIVKPLYGWKSKRLLGYYSYRNTLYDEIGTEFNYSVTAAQTSGRESYGFSANIADYPKFFRNQRRDIRFGLEYLNIFDLRSFDPQYWTKGRTTIATGSWKSQRQWFLSEREFLSNLRIGNATTSGVSSNLFAKISTEYVFNHKLDQSESLNLRVFAGFTATSSATSLPRQEYWFASGGIDPSFREFFIYDRSGNTPFSPLRNWHVADGINLRGYRGYAGNRGAIGINAEYWFRSTFAFCDFGDAFDRSDRFVGHFDLGVGIKAGPLKFYVPLFLNHPEDADGFAQLIRLKSLKYRWALELDLKGFSVSL